MLLLPVLEAIDRASGYVELLRYHPQVSPSHLRKCELILADIASFVDELVQTPIPQCANYLRPCIARVLQNIARTERNIASANATELGVSELLRLRTAETALEALRFELDVLSNTLENAVDDASALVN